MDTGARQGLGYGGARNAIFFLAPILREAYRRGKRTLQQISKTPNSWLLNIRNRTVLGKANSFPQEISEATLCMGDDDMNIPVSNVFSDALFASRFKDKYFTLRYYFYGRRTDQFTSDVGLEVFLNHPYIAYRYTRWSPFAVLGGLNGSLTKPKFCLNFPFPCEEQHFHSLELLGELFRLPWIHLGGTRYPTDRIPTKTFIGLKEHLAFYVPYIFENMFVQWLMYPEKQQPEILPWNDSQKKFSSLYEVFADAIKQKEHMEKNFWHRLKLLFDPNQTTKPFLLIGLETLWNSSVERMIKTFALEHDLSPREKKELREIGMLYKGFQTDAFIFQEFCLMLLQNDLIMKSKIMQREL